MFKRIKTFIQSRKQEKWFDDGMWEIIRGTVNSAYNRLSNHNMGMTSIQGYIRHLPIIGIEAINCTALALELCPE